MPLGIGNKGKNGGNQPKFEPTEMEREFLALFLEDRMVPFLEVKKQILGQEHIIEGRRERLSEWFRDERAKNPGGTERIRF